MMDGNQGVRTAAADALKKIDEPMYKLATAIYINTDVNAISMAQKQGVAAEPLTPLIQAVATSSLATIQAMAATEENSPVFRQYLDLHRDCISALSEIAQSDVAANRFIISSLGFQLVAPKSKAIQSDYSKYSAQTRAVVIQSVGKMANVKQALKLLLALASTDVSANRIAAMQLLVNIVDSDNKAAIKRTFEAHRFDKDPNIRSTVEDCIKKLEAKN